MTARIIILFLVSLLGFTAGTTLGVATPKDRNLKAGTEGSWYRWARMPFSQRAAFVETFNEVSRRESSTEVFASARFLSSLSPHRFRAFQSLRNVYEDALEELPPDRAARIRDLPPAARATWLFRKLESENPAVIAELRESFGC